VAGRPFRAVYRFAPGEEDDGVTLAVPPELLSAIRRTGSSGASRDSTRRRSGRSSRVCRSATASSSSRWGEGRARRPGDAPGAEEAPLFKAVAEFVKRRFGVDIPAREWALADVPRHLRMRVAVTDPVTGRVIDAGRDVELLRKKLGAADQAPSKVESPAWREAQLVWEKDGIEGWTFGDLPEKIAVGTSLTAYPALAAGEKSVRLFPARAEAEASHKKGVRALLMRKFAKELASSGATTRSRPSSTARRSSSAAGRPSRAPSKRLWPAMSSNATSAPRPNTRPTKPRSAAPFSKRAMP